MILKFNNWGNKNKLKKVAEKIRTFPEVIYFTAKNRDIHFNNTTKRDELEIQKLLKNFLTPIEIDIINKNVEAFNDILKELIFYTHKDDLKRFEALGVPPVDDIVDSVSNWMITCLAERVSLMPSLKEQTGKWTKTFTLNNKSIIFELNWNSSSEEYISGAFGEIKVQSNYIPLITVNIGIDLTPMIRLTGISTGTKEIDKNRVVKKYIKTVLEHELTHFWEELHRPLEDFLREGEALQNMMKYTDNDPNLEVLFNLLYLAAGPELRARIAEKSNSDTNIDRAKTLITQTSPEWIKTLTGTKWEPIAKEAEKIGIKYSPDLNIWTNRFINFINRRGNIMLRKIQKRNDNSRNNR